MANTQNKVRVSYPRSFRLPLCAMLPFTAALVFFVCERHLYRHPPRSPPSLSEQYGETQLMVAAGKGDEGSIPPFQEAFAKQQPVLTQSLPLQGTLKGLIEGGADLNLRNK
eukprot:3699028-Rhodomonas_salina.1